MVPDISKVDTDRYLDPSRSARNFRDEVLPWAFSWVTGIGKESINLDGLPVFADENGPFGSPTSDSERAMITLSTRKLLMVVITFSGSEHLQLYTARAATLLMRYEATDSTLRRFMVG